MTNADWLLSILVLVIAALGTTALVLIWQMQRRAVHYWPLFFDYVLRGEISEEGEGSKIQESIDSLTKSARSLSTSTELFQTLMFRMQESWSDPPPRCSESVTIHRMENTLERLVEFLKESKKSAQGGDNNG